VSKLRGKLELAMPDRHFIHTHQGFGYRFQPEPSRKASGPLAPSVGATRSRPRRRRQVRPSTRSSNRIPSRWTRAGEDLSPREQALLRQMHETNGLPLWTARTNLGWAEALAGRVDAGAQEHAANARKLSREGWRGRDRGDCRRRGMRWRP